MVTETAIAPTITPIQLVTSTATYRPVPTTTPFTPFQSAASTATYRSVPTTTPLPTITPVGLLPAIPATLPPDACPPNQPDSIIQYSLDAADYRGKQFAELPVGWEDLGIISVSHNGEYFVRKVEQQGSLMLWLGKAICRHYPANHNGLHLEITDVLFLPLEDNGLHLIDSACWKVADYPVDSAVEESRRWVVTLLAIGFFEDYYDAPKEILFAWEINLEAGRFEELSPETVACTGLLGL